VRTVEALRMECARVLDEAVDAAAGSGPRLFLHQRLARSWKAPERDAQLIRRALVLSADNEMNGAVVATRAAAGGGAAPAAAASGRPDDRADRVAHMMGGDRVGRRPGSSPPAARPTDAARRAHAAGGLGSAGPDYPGGDPRAASPAGRRRSAGRPGPRRCSEGEAVDGRQAPGFALAVAVARAPHGAAARRGAGPAADWPARGSCWAMRSIRRLDGSPIRARLRYVGPEPGAH
jgi:citrate synthase